MRGAMKRSRGFTYIGLLVAIVLIGSALAAVAEVWSVQARREREVELQYRGHAIRRAIGLYVALNPGGAARYPMDLEDLLQDDRWPQVRRYLRRLYEDPMTGKADWTLIRAPDGGIMGVASASEVEPIKRAGFSPEDAAFNDADCYCDWKFIYQPRRRFWAPAMPAVPTGNPATPTIPNGGTTVPGTPTLGLPTGLGTGASPGGTAPGGAGPASGGSNPPLFNP
jgi:type II secretory pathway pseudopilin PulG